MEAAVYNYAMYGKGCSRFSGIESQNISDQGMLCDIRDILRMTVQICFGVTPSLLHKAIAGGLVKKTTNKKGCAPSLANTCFSGARCAAGIFMYF